MKEKNYLYTSGEFAKLTGINKRTLHYYNNIGLFSPEIIEKNGYHYYTCFQFARLELILTLRKIGLSIDEIREYVTEPSDESFSQIMEKKKKLFHLYDNFESRISIDSIRKRDFSHYTSFYAYCPDTSEIYDEVLPGGKYLRAFCIGDWGTLPNIYEAILAYANEHRLTLTGYAYEEGLNEMAIKNQRDYITMITIPCSS